MNKNSMTNRLILGLLLTLVVFVHMAGNLMGLISILVR